MNARIPTTFPRNAGASGDVFSPSDRKIIRMEDYRRDQLRLRPAPTVHLPGWMIACATNDPTPPTGAPAAALRAAA